MQNIKLVVWDLDGTLWDGIWIEDGENVQWKPGIGDVIRSLDRMGILQSIASRNVADDALLEFLEDKGIMKYMLYPQIIHQPKSLSLLLIKNSLGLSRWDEIAFVDDRDFEKEEVAHQYSDVLLLNHENYPTFPIRERLYRRRTTDTDRRRRELYQTNRAREQEAEAYTGDYQGYLETLKMKAVIRPMVDADVDRVHQLMERTNRFNTAVDVVPLGRLYEILHTHSVTTVWVMELRDRLGDYGIIGFKIVRNESVVDSGLALIEPAKMPEEEKHLICIDNMALSCQIAGRGLGSSLVIHTMVKAVSNGKGVMATYRETKHNSKMSQLYDFLGFWELHQDNYVEGKSNRLFLWDHSKGLPDYPTWLDVSIVNRPLIDADIHSCTIKIHPGVDEVEL